MSTVSLALQITLVGMGLVFAAILLLWGLMALLVRLARAPEATLEPPMVAEEGMEEQAAAAAVAFALQREAQATQAGFPLPPTAFVSAWQAVRRSSQLNRRGPVR
jgi:Na+-transporting methylmalonyl-CoA/oxaloacetate decarboxylase gamma subunit